MMRSEMEKDILKVLVTEEELEKRVRELGKEIYEKFAIAGVGTVVGMHFPESHIEEARKNNINIVISGHMSSDSLGINLICDVWEREGIDVIPCSGFTRHSRN